MARLISNKKLTEEYLIKWLNSSLDKLGDDDSMTDWLLDELNRNSILKSLPNTLDISRENLMPRLTKAFVEEEIVLVLGAGVSMQFGLPGWNELLQNIMITTIEEEHDKAALLAKLFSVMFNPNSLIAGRYLQNYYNDKKSNFNEIVRDVIYESIDMSKPSNLMDEIVNLCVSPGRFPNIDSVITYNFDDILENKISNVGIPVSFLSVYKVGMDARNQLPIYHVHGFLPQSGELSQDNQVTFGESIYHQQYSDTYSWNNIVQINKFREKTCLFIGTSLSDPNVRRLLDIAKKQKGNDEKVHFIFKLRNDVEVIKSKLKFVIEKDEEQSSVKDINLEETAKFLIDIIERFEEADTDSFGVKTVWVNNWNEVPDILREMRESAIK